MKSWSTQRSNIVDKASQICFRTDSRQTILGKGAKWLLLWIIKKLSDLGARKILMFGQFWAVVPKICMEIAQKSEHFPAPKSDQ